MSHRSFITASLLFGSLSLVAAPAAAQSRGHVSRGGSSTAGRATAGRAAPRSSPPPRSVRPVYRPYVYSYRSPLRLGLYAGYGYPYGYYSYPYGYSSYGYVPYSYGSYGYGYPGAYGPSSRYAWGGVRIKDAEPDAQVVVDGYYVGIVDDFDGVFQQLNLEAGAHKIEIRAQNAPPLAFEVNVLPGQTITYRAAQQH